MTHEQMEIARLTQERDQAREEARAFVVEKLEEQTRAIEKWKVILDQANAKMGTISAERDRAVAEVAVLRSVLDSAELLERLADIEHERWSGWETYRSVCMNQGKGIHPSGERFAQRWKRLRETPYTQLTEAGKESDRIEARKSLAAIRQYLDASAPLASQAAAMLAEIAGWDQKPDVNPYGDSQGKLYDVWEKAQEYRAALKTPNKINEQGKVK